MRKFARISVFQNVTVGHFEFGGHHESAKSHHNGCNSNHLGLLQNSLRIKNCSCTLLQLSPFTHKNRIEVQIFVAASSKCLKVHFNQQNCQLKLGFLPFDDNRFFRSQSFDHILSPCKELLRTAGGDSSVLSPTRGATPDLLLANDSGYYSASQATSPRQVWPNFELGGKS